VTLRSGASISGRIEFDGTLPKPPPAMMERYQVRVEPLDPRLPKAQLTYVSPVDRAGNWKITEVPPGPYLVTFLAYLEDRRAMAGWETKGATLEGRDVSTLAMHVQGNIEGVILTITDRPSELRGTVRDANGRVDPGAAVVLFTTLREVWGATGRSNRRARMVRASEDGTFVIRGIPAGDYFLAAIPDEDAGDWPDVRLMETLSRASTRLTIADSERKSQDLTTRPVR
jgi:hypothetical protein